MSHVRSEMCDRHHLLFVGALRSAFHACSLFCSMTGLLSRRRECGHSKSSYYFSLVPVVRLAGSVVRKKCTATFKSVPYLLVSGGKALDPNPLCPEFYVSDSGLISDRYRRAAPFERPTPSRRVSQR